MMTLSYLYVKLIPRRSALSDVCCGLAQKNLVCVEISPSGRYDKIRVYVISKSAATEKSPQIQHCGNCYNYYQN